MKRRAEDRGALSAKAVRWLANDPRVEAAYFWGSIGRGEEDSWSDLDLWLLVEPGAYEDFVRDRKAWIAELGKPVLIVESPQNGPAAGNYLMSGYDSPTGLLLVDWYWQPIGTAEEPSTARWIFGEEAFRNRRIQEGERLTDWDPDSEQERQNRAHLAYAMVAIQAKHLARGGSELGFRDFIDQLIGRSSAESDSPVEWLRGACRELRMVASEPYEATVRLLDVVEEHLR